MNRRLIGRHLALLAVCAAWVLAVYRLGILCPIRYLTGVPCPFCGMTRAWLSALGGDWAAALRFHPLFLLGPPLIWAAVHSKVWPLSRLPRRSLSLPRRREQPVNPPTAPELGAVLHWAEHCVARRCVEPYEQRVAAN